MNTSYPTSEQLESLPTALWLKVGTKMLLCRGAPSDIVRGMAKELGIPASPKARLRPVLVALGELLAQEARILIELEARVPDARLAPLFVHALLTTGIGRPMAKA